MVSAIDKVARRWYKVGVRVFDYSPQNMGAGKIIKRKGDEITVRYKIGRKYDSSTDLMYNICSEDVAALSVVNPMRRVLRRR